MKLIRFENVNLLSIIEAAAGILIIATIIKLIDEIFSEKPANTFPVFVKPQPKKRKDFTESTKKQTLFSQGYRCAMCFQPNQFFDFHHKDGNRNNNQPSNCEALCPICHAKKTRKMG